MPKFKKVIRKQVGGGMDYGAAARDQANYVLGKGPYAGGPETEAGIMRSGLAGVLKSAAPGVPTAADMQLMLQGSGVIPANTGLDAVVARPALNRPAVRKAPMPTKRAVVPEYLDRDMGAFSALLKSDPDLMKTIAAGVPGLPSSSIGAAGKATPTGEGAIPKTKAGMKKFMQEYGKFIALGAMAGAGGKGGQIAAPIIAALPGLIEILKGRGKGKVPTQRAVGMENPLGNLPGPPVAKAHGGSMAKKSSGGDTPKKSEGGAIRKFKGGSMNMKKDMLTPKYKKGGNMPKGKAAGEMPQHKKMAMGKPTPQSTGQKFAKGGAAKYAGGGMCKGYGIAKKIRPTGPMN